jgi:chromosome segregation ATPase
VLNDVKDRKVSSESLCCVRCADFAEQNQLKLYPDQMAIVFKASKLTAALDLIDKLRSTAAIYEPALKAVDQIQDINRMFAPELERWIAKISADIEALNVELEPYKNELSLVEEQIGVHNSEIDSIYKADSQKRTLFAITEEYRKAHPELADLEMRRGKMRDKVNEINARIMNFNNFSTTLQRCYQRIDERLLMSA